jgi:hypothetical protein
MVNPEGATMRICKGCGQPLKLENYRIADGCPCNSGRGINHGLVDRRTCTCPHCDPDYTGSTRYPPIDADPDRREKEGR